MGFWRNQLLRPTDPAADAAWDGHEPRKGFFTDTSICIGCKACEVACKEWNGIPERRRLDLLGSSYDNTGVLGASTWRHVAFIEQTQRPHRAGPGVRPGAGRPRYAGGALGDEPRRRWRHAPRRSRRRRLRRTLDTRPPDTAGRSAG